MGKTSGPEYLETEQVAEFASASDPVVRSQVAGDDFPRFVLQADGTQLLGDGTAAPAVPIVSIATDVVELTGDGAPTDTETGADVAGPGSRYTDITNGVLYINTGTKASPTWVTVGSQT